MCRLYKQGTVGPCNAPKPSFFDRKGRAKWQAWADLGQLPGGEAQQRYVDLLTQLMPGWAASSSGSGTGGGGKRGGAGGPVQSRMAEAAEDEQAAVRSRGGARADLSCTTTVGCPPPAQTGMQHKCSTPGHDIGCPQVGWFSMDRWLQRLSKPNHPPAQGPDATPPLLQAARAGDAAAVEALLRGGADAGQRGSEGEAALHWAADRGHEAVVALLLSHGADVNAADSDGQTACHYAALAEQRSAAQLLAAAPGVQLGLRNADGETAADLAPPGWDFLQAAHN